MTAYPKLQTRQACGQVPLFYPPSLRPVEIPWTVTVYDGNCERKRWLRFNEAANRSYAGRGLRAIGEEQVIDIDRYPTFFAEATVLDAQGGEHSIGGIRIHGPDADGELPLFEELAGFLDVEILRTLVAGLRPARFCHGGGLWIDPAYAKSGLAADLARACAPIIAASNATWCLAMTHTVILDAWSSLGWDAVSSIPSFVYPDERYRSSVILGGPGTWPEPVARWALEQGCGKHLEAPGARITIAPMDAP